MLPYTRSGARLLAAACAVLVFGCGGGDTPTQPAAITGTYTLQTINGSPLPYVTFQDASNNKDEIVGETFTLAEGGQWSHTYRERLTISGSASTTDGQTSGTFNGSASALSFTSTVNERFTGQVNGNTLTLQRVARTLVYTR
jgi:hypothetical protein